MYGFLDGKIVTTVGELKGKSDSDYENLKGYFDKDLFTNSLEKTDEKYNNKKIDDKKEIIYTGYTNKKQNDNCNIDVKIPYINMKNSIIDKYNKEIQSTFQKKAEDMEKNDNKFSIYTVEYSGYIQDGILSLIIRANLKEGANAQKVIIKTYNYNLEEQKEVKLEDILNMKKVEKKFVQDRIIKEIKSAQKNAEYILQSGYPIYERDIEDSRYKVENISEFYFHDGSIYIIFAYGNEKNTSEVDIAVI